MVKQIAASVGDNLYDEVIEKGKSLGLNSGSEIVRYALAIILGYPESKAKNIAKIKPQTLSVIEINEV